MYSTFILVFYLVLGLCPSSFAAQYLQIPKADRLLMAERVFKNECYDERDCLLEWDKGEDFLSIGLEHFIWSPANSSSIFKDTFKSYLEYAREKGKHLPKVLDKNPLPPCPWDSRGQFLKSKNSREYQDITEFLIKTKQCQADYLIETARQSLQKIIRASPQSQLTNIQNKIALLSNNPDGVYAIIDYVNFKGTGIGASEKYEGEGWGLLQVLEGMRDGIKPQEVLPDFVRSARNVLNHRVFNAPHDRHEEKWLPGWQKRVDTYLAIDAPQ